MAIKTSASQQLLTQLGGHKHEHPLLPLEYNHPVTVTDSDVPAGLTTENVAVVELRGTRFTSLNGNDFPMQDWVAAFDVVKDRYGDNFDIVVFFTDPRLPAIPYSGYHRGVYNEIKGINRNAFNSRSTWGSDRLQSQIWMGRFSLGTLLQEVGHRWGSFARYRLTRTGPVQSDLMLPNGGHWAREFDDGDSPMDYDEVRHIRQSADTWLREPIGGFEFRYCGLDLYLMGMIAPGKVGKFTLIQRYTEIGRPLPGGRQMIQGRALDLNAKNVVWAEGRRAPGYVDSQKHFRVAFVVITRDAARLDQQVVKKTEMLRQQLERYFALATLNRGCMDTRLCGAPAATRSGTTHMTLRANRITWNKNLLHGLGPVPVKVEVGYETTIGGKPIDSWSREMTPDITTGVQHLEAQVDRDPYNGAFAIVAQAKGSDLDLNMRWVASTLG